MLKNIFRWIGLVVIVLATIATVDFLFWRNQQIKRLEAGSSLALTSKGLVEYATTGSGPAVLVLHGTLGGYDQAQLLARMLDMPDRKFIFVSRPGYLRTPLASGATFEEQADIYAALLDELGIEQAAVMATSGGGPSALQFALRHPERCWGMVLIAANSDVNAGDGKEADSGRTGQPPVWVTNILFSDLTSWLIVRAAQVMPRKVLAATVGGGYVEGIMHDPGKYNNFSEFLGSIAMLSRRRTGSLNDGQQFLGYSNYPFERIRCPTLILYGNQDTFVPLAEQIYLSDTLPDSKYLEIEGGTHFMAISHGDVLGTAITDFLNAQVPAR